MLKIWANGDATYQEKLLSLVDESAWKKDDREWVKARKAQWAELSKKLKARDEVTHPLLQNRTTNYWKSYFLSGELASTEHLVSMIGLDINPFFILWFHPDQSEENLNAIVGRIKQVSVPPVFNVWAKTVEYFVNEVLGRCHGSGLRKLPWLGEEGVLGGKERFYLRLLIGSGVGGYVDSKWVGKLDFMFFHRLASYFFDPDADADWPFLEIVDYYLTTSARYVEPYGEGQKWRQRLVLQVICHFDELRVLMRQDPLWQRNAEATVNAIKDAIESRSLTDFLHEEWRFVKEEQGKTPIPNELVVFDAYYPAYEKLLKAVV